jgi:hypothetical protein
MVDGLMYLDYPELDTCCTCCSWEEGCGPIVSGWTSNAIYEGQAVVNGTTCDKFSIQGVETKPNFLFQTLNASKVCELNNGGHEKFVFDLPTFTPSVNPAFFQLPTTRDCTKRCGAAPQPYDCKAAYLNSRARGI